MTDAPTVETPSREELLQRLLAAELEVRKRKTPEEAARLGRDLEERFKALQESYKFVPGMLVEWKPGLRNKKRPLYGEPFLVVDILEQPIIDSHEDSGSPYFHEPLDLIAGLLDSDGDLMLFHLDSRRVQPFQGKP
jgi:hypothetical protein